MTIEIKVPQLPESVSDATLVAWHRKKGDSVARDENLVDLETDKVVLEVPAPAGGILQEIKIQDGATVVAGDVLAILLEGEAEAQWRLLDFGAVVVHVFFHPLRLYYDLEGLWSEVPRVELAVPAAQRVVQEYV